MLRTLIVGLGRAGLGLHWAVLRKLRAAGEHPDLFAPAPVLALDPTVVPTATGDGLLPVPSLERAVALLDPAETVVHLCTPPVTRLGLLRELSEAGFRRIVVEKPLATGVAEAHAIHDLAVGEGLELDVVAPWLASSLTRRLAALVAEGKLGALRTIGIRQYKPRMRRTLADLGHPTAFDIEPPHSVGVCLRLAGDAEVISAGLSDMRIGETVVPGMGRAELRLRHAEVTSHIVSDLTAPLRERRIELGFEGGRVVAHYPNAEDDCYAQLRLQRPGLPEQLEIFPDDALSAQMTGSYRAFLTGGAPGANGTHTDAGAPTGARDGRTVRAARQAALRDAVRVVELLAEAKSRSREARTGGPSHAETRVSHVA